MNFNGKCRWNLSKSIVFNGILLLQLLFTTGTLARQHNGAVIGPSSHRLPLSTHRSGITESSYSNILDATIIELRGGASKRGGNRKARTATLSSKSKSSSTTPTAKSATGAKKVGAAAAAAKAQKKGPLASVMTKYRETPPVTRVYLKLVGLMTAAGLLLGEEAAQGLLALDPTRIIRGWELWRPLTAATFLGKPSMSWFFSLYYSLQYGTQLETSYGSAQFFVFLLTEIIVLTVMSGLFGQPFFAQSVVTAMLQVLSRSAPYQKVNWLLFNVDFWVFPLALMFADVLQSQQLMSAVPHITGMLAGHFYYFHKFVWPKKRGGVDWLVAPEVFAKQAQPVSAKKKAFAEAFAKLQSKGRKRKGRKLSDK